MSYINAGIVLPETLIREIQKYVNGTCVYIPQSEPERGRMNRYRQEIDERNCEIYRSFLQGSSISQLSGEFFLSEKSIYRILNQMKR